MKIVWATPFREGSAIARYSAGVVAELRRRGHEVAIYRTEVGTDAELPPLRDTCVLQQESQQEHQWLRDADIIFANIGDHFAFHGRILELARRQSFIAILHDWCLLNLFWGWLIDQHRLHDVSRLVTEIYGPEAGEMCATATWQNLQERSTRYFPMTEWVADLARGSIIHSEFYRARVEGCCPGPVHKISLAYPVATVPQGRRSKPSDRSRLAVRTFGMVNANKRIDLVIRALAADPDLSERASYHVLGPVDDAERERLDAICREVNFKGLVLEGRVTHARLMDGMAEADVICCLRDPPLEGASASAIEGMQSGAPVIVSNAGFYADLPNEYVLKVPTGDCEQELLARLRQVDRDREWACRMGSAAAAWAAIEFSAERYVDGLERVIPEFIAVEPYVSTAQALGRELGRIGLTGNSRAASKIASTLEAMFSL